MADYRFTERAEPNGSIRLEWAKAGAKPDPLDFWIVAPAEVEQAKSRVRAGEFDG